MSKRNLDGDLAKFLRKQRGEMSYVEFAKKIGVGLMTAGRLESGEHHITLKVTDCVGQAEGQAFGHLPVRDLMQFYSTDVRYC